MAWLFGWWLCLLCGILSAGPREWFLLFENVGEKVYKEGGLPLLKLTSSSARSPSSPPLSLLCTFPVLVLARRFLTAIPHLFQHRQSRVFLVYHLAVHHLRLITSSLHRYNKQRLSHYSNMPESSTQKAQYLDIPRVRSPSALFDYI